jgi:Uma2 family endonuclease
MDIKMAYYQKIPSLQVYIMVSRKDYLLHVLERHADGWSVRAVLGQEQHLHLEFFNLTIPVAAIYEDVNLEK